MDNEEIYQLAVKKWGPTLQFIMLFEEMSELQKACTKYLREQGSKQEIIEEIADVQIMLEQLMVMLDIPEKLVGYEKDLKINKLEDMLR